jgi:hypothetical protein
MPITATDVPLMAPGSGLKIPLIVKKGSHKCSKVKRTQPILCVVHSHVIEICGKKIKLLSDQRINSSLVKIFVYILVRPQCPDYTHALKSVM